MLKLLLIDGSVSQIYLKVGIVCRWPRGCGNIDLSFFLASSSILQPSWYPHSLSSRNLIFSVVCELMCFKPGGCERERSDVFDPGEDAHQAEEQHQPLPCKVSHQMKHFQRHNGVSYLDDLCSLFSFQLQINGVRSLDLTMFQFFISTEGAPYLTPIPSHTILIHSYYLLTNQRTHRDRCWRFLGT